MFIRPPFIIAAVLAFSVLNGWALINGFRENNAWSCTLALLAVGGTFYFVHLYHQLLSTPPDEAEQDPPESI